MKNSKKVAYTFIILISCVPLQSSWTKKLNEWEDGKINLTSQEIYQLKEQTKDANSKLIQAARNLDLENMQMALDQGANVDYQDEDGNTAFHYLQINNKTLFSYAKLEGFLLYHSANQCIANNVGQTVKNMREVKTFPYAEFINNILRPATRLPDGSYVTEASVINNNSLILQATAEIIFADTDAQTTKN